MIYHRLRLHKLPILWLPTFFFVLLANGCVDDSDLEAMNGDTGFELVITSPSLPALEIESDTYIISDDDIVQYNWDEQVIAISPEFSSLYQPDGTFLQDGSHFVVILNGEQLVDGQVVFFLTARRLLGPVMVPYDKALLDWQPIFPQLTEHSAGLFLQLMLADDELGRIRQFPVDDPEIQEQVRQYFSIIGKLQ